MISTILPKPSPLSPYRYMKVVPSIQVAGTPSTENFLSDTEHLKFGAAVGKIALGSVVILAGGVITAAAIAMAKEAHQRKLTPDTTLIEKAHQITNDIFQQSHYPLDAIPIIEVRDNIKKEGLKSSTKSVLARYYPSNHKIGISRKAYIWQSMNRLDFLQDTSHETFHALMALLRSRLPLNEYQALVQNTVRQVIKYDKSLILVAKSFGPIFKIPPELKHDYLKFIEEDLFKREPDVSLEYEFSKIKELQAKMKLLPAFQALYPDNDSQNEALEGFMNHYGSLGVFYKNLWEIRELNGAHPKLGIMPVLEGVELDDARQNAKRFMKDWVNTFSKKNITFQEYQQEHEEILARLFSQRYIANKLYEVITAIESGKPNPYMELAGLESNNKVSLQRLHKDLSRAIRESRREEKFFKKIYPNDVIPSLIPRLPDVLTFKTTA